MAKAKKEKVFGYAPEFMFGVVGALALVVSLSTAGQTLGRDNGILYERTIDRLVATLEDAGFSVSELPLYVANTSGSPLRPSASGQIFYEFADMSASLNALQAFFTDQFMPSIYVAAPPDNVGAEVKETTETGEAIQSAPSIERTPESDDAALIVAVSLETSTAGGTISSETTEKAQEILILLDEISGTLELLAAAE